MKRAKLNMLENVTYRVFDKDGNAKKVFQENKFAQYLLKKGLLSVDAVTKVPLLFGRYADEKVIANLVVDAGFVAVAERIGGIGSTAAFDYIAIGTGTTAADATDTALETEISTGGGERAQVTPTLTTTTVTNDTLQLQNTFNFTGSFAITESGVLNAASTGDLLARQVFSAINVVNGDSVQITWQFAVSDS